MRSFCAVQGTVQGFAERSDKINYLRRVVRVRQWQYKRGFMPIHVYYDQLEELGSKISHLKREQNDILELWCVEKPGDEGCKAYDL